MKTKFDIGLEVFEYDSLEECYKYYERNYKRMGFIYNKDTEEVYKVVKKEIQLNEGDRICLAGLYRIVEWKCIDIDSNMIIYALKEE